MTTLILGSSSPYRKELLERLMVPFSCISPEIDETPFDGETPIQLVERLAIEKAKAAGENLPNSLVIGSDQVALHITENGEKKIVGKPHTHEVAVQQLKQASGKSITLFTGLALYNTDTQHIQSDVIPFTVHFRTLNDEQIENYLLKEKPYNCAGSVKSEGLGTSLIQRFDGDDPSALIGLPLIRLVSMLYQEDFQLY